MKKKSRKKPASSSIFSPRKQRSVSVRSLDIRAHAPTAVLFPQVNAASWQRLRALSKRQSVLRNSTQRSAISTHSPNPFFTAKGAKIAKEQRNALRQQAGATPKDIPCDNN